MSGDRRPPARRRRDAAATRQALLIAARVQIAQRGFAATTTRDVAAAVGVDQALVYRYFGSKEKLLAEAAGAQSVVDGQIADTPVPDLPRLLLERILDVSEAVAHGPSSLTTLLTGVNDAAVRDLVRKRIEGGFGERIAGRLEGPDAALRAELLAALLAGIAFLREKVGTRALAAADRDTIAEYVDAMAAALLAPPAR